MKTFQTRTRTLEDGTLQLSFPTDTPNSDLDVVVVVQERKSDPVRRDRNGWPEGFFERFHGAMKDDPLVRPEQLPLDDIVIP